MDWLKQTVLSRSGGASAASVATEPVWQRFFSAIHSNSVTSYISDVFIQRPILSTAALASLAGYAALRRALAPGMCKHREDLTGKVVVITGGHSGIGLETTKILAGMGSPFVILGIKNPDFQKDLIEKIQAETGNSHIRALKLDLADLESIKAFSDELKTQHNHVDILIENAGIIQAERRTTKNNFETTFGVNHLGHMYLAYQLMSLLRAAQGEARVVVLSSFAHLDQKVAWDDLQWTKRKYETGLAYAESKLANVLFATELNRRMSRNSRSNHITANAVHPGVIQTPILRELSTKDWVITMILFFILGKTPFQGAQTTVHAAISPELRAGGSSGGGGHYLVDCAVAKPGKEVNAENGARLWEISCNLLGIPVDW